MQLSLEEVLVLLDQAEVDKAILRKQLKATQDDLAAVVKGEASVIKPRPES